MIDRRAATVFRATWLIAGLALALGLVRARVLRDRALTPLEGGAPWSEGKFQPDGVYTTTIRGALPRHIDHRGSWLGTDEWQGRAATAWLRAPASEVRVCVAGYPQHAGCKLWVEFRGADGAISRAKCPLENPHEEWKPWDFHPPKNTVAVRVVAEDAATDPEGWLAFSQPFVETPRLVVASYELAQIVTTLALALTLVWGPGILWTPRSAAPEIRFAAWVLVGPSLLGAAGVLVWVGGGLIRPEALATSIVAVLWAALGWSIWKQPALELTGAKRCVLAVSVLVVVAVVAKATYSGGPEGELYGGTIARTLAVGDRSDARIPFFVVQVATQHLPPGSAETERYFSPWTFFSRGPLAGLAALPLVLATGGEPPIGWPEAHPWQPFDATGYAAYRILMFVLASGVIVALFAALALVVGEGWALVGAGLLALSPFGVHEVMFTWPKWAATAAVVVSFMLAHARRPFCAGLALAIGFYQHPMALLSAPWIGLWALGRAEKNFPALATTALRIAGGAAICVLPWMAIAARMPHLPESVHAGHGSFLHYWVMADYGPATWESWTRTRWRHLADTFIPFRLWAVDGDHFTLSSVYAPSGQLIRFAFSWWNSLPLGMGLGLWVLSLFALAQALRKWPAAAWLLIIGPALMIVAYWGAISVGLLRECGHGLFVAVIGVTCVVAARTNGWWSRVLRHPLVPWLQLPETLLMLWLTTFAVPQKFHPEFAQLDPLYLGLNLAALGAVAWMIAAQRRNVFASNSPQHESTGADCARV